MYGINLELKGRKAVVVGGGKVAERKAIGLLDEDAEVTVVSPMLTDRLMELADAGHLTWLNKTFSKEDLEGAFLIFAATDNREVNLAVKENSAPGQLVNMTDNPLLSDFQVPSVVKRGKLSIAVSTSGASPILAKKIRSQLEDTFDERYEAYMEFLSSCRKAILAEVGDETKKKQLLAAITEESFLNDQERMDRFAKMLKEAIE